MKAPYVPAVTGMLIFGVLSTRCWGTPPQAPLARNSLQGTHWELVIPAWKPGPRSKVQAPTLDFTTERLSAYAGCNRMSGAYQVNGMAIKIAPLMSTRMACGPELDRFEGEFGQALQTATQWQLSRDGEVLLLQGKTKAFVFRKSKAGR